MYPRFNIFKPNKISFKSSLTRSYVMSEQPLTLTGLTKRNFSNHSLQENFEGGNHNYSSDNKNKQEKFDELETAFGALISVNCLVYCFIGLWGIGTTVYDEIEEEKNNRESSDSFRATMNCSRLRSFNEDSKNSILPIELRNLNTRCLAKCDILEGYNSATSKLRFSEDLAGDYKQIKSQRNRVTEEIDSDYQKLALASRDLKELKENSK